MTKYIKTSKVQKIPSEKQLKFKCLKFRRSPNLKKAVIKSGLALLKDIEKEKNSRKSDLSRVLRIFVKG